MMSVCMPSCKRTHSLSPAFPLSIKPRGDPEQAVYLGASVLAVTPSTHRIAARKLKLVHAALTCNIFLLERRAAQAFWELISEEVELGKAGRLHGKLTFIRQMGNLQCKLWGREACSVQNFSSGTWPSVWSVRCLPLVC